MLKIVVPSGSFLVTPVTLFAALFGLGWLAQYGYYTSVYPAIQDVIEPRLRATAVAVYFAGMYLLGGAFGPAVVGGLSDALARSAMAAAVSSIGTFGSTRCW